jgi:hypothetical protein
MPTWAYSPAIETKSLFFKSPHWLVSIRENSVDNLVYCTYIHLSAFLQCYEDVPGIAIEKQCPAGTTKCLTLVDCHFPGCFMYIPYFFKYSNRDFVFAYLRLGSQIIKFSYRYKTLGLSAIWPDFRISLIKPCLILIIKKRAKMQRITHSNESLEWIFEFEFWFSHRSARHA